MKKPRFRHLKHKRDKQADKTAITFCPPAEKARRFKAFIVDCFMLLMPILYGVIYLVMGSREIFAQHKLEGWAYIIIAFIVAEVLFWLKSAQTPGMRAYDLYLCDPRTNRKPRLRQMVLRAIFMWIGFFLLIGVILFLLHPKGKTLHDALSATVIAQT